MVEEEEDLGELFLLFFEALLEIATIITSKATKQCHRYAAINKRMFEPLSSPSINGSVLD